MKVLVLTQYFLPEIGAPQVRFSSVVKELIKSGDEVEVVTALPNHPTGRIFSGYRGKFYMKEDWEGAKVHRVWVYAAIGGGIKRLTNYLSFCLTSIWGLLKCRRPDVILVESPPLFIGITAVLFAKIWRRPFIFNVADLWPDSIKELGMMGDGLAFRILVWLECWIYRKARFVNGVTEGICQTIVEAKGISADKILFLPNGADTDLFCPGEVSQELFTSLGLEGKRVILYAGTIGFAQGLDVVVRAAQIMSENKKYEDIQFVFIGDGSDRQKLEEMIQERNIQSITFLPPNSPQYVAKLFKASWLGFVSLLDLPLFEGARPSKMFPIMATGLPVLYSGAGEGARLISKSKAGLVATPEKEDDLVRAIDRFLDDDEFYFAAGKNGRKFVSKHYSWTPIVKTWRDEVLKGVKHD